MGTGSSVQQKYGAGKGKEKAAASEGSGSLAGSSRIECNSCRNVQAVPCGTAAFDCAKCGARVLVALPAVAEQAAAQLSRHILAAQDAVRGVLDQQAAVCRCLWDKLQEDLGFEAAIWDSALVTEAADGARALLLEAIASCDGAQLEEALARAQEAGLPPPSAALRESLATFREEEDAETLWRCLERALREADRIDLQFWCDEAQSQSLLVPVEVTSALQALHAAEHARLAELEYQSTMEARTVSAVGRGDAQALRVLVQEARAMGADASLAEVALASLQDGGADAGAGPGRGADGAGAADDLLGLDVPSLRALLAAAGEDPGPDCSREELMRRLLASQGAAQAPPEAGAAQAPPQAAARAEAAGGPATADAAGGPGATAPPRGPAAPPHAGAAGAGADSAAGGAGPGAPPPGPSAPPPEAERESGTRQEGRQGPASMEVGQMTRGMALVYLGLSGQPGPAEVRRAYKQAALRWHPDRRQNHDRAEEATFRFQQIRAAFDFLLADLPPHR